jgi:translation initiation factor 2 subunit 2
MDEEYNNLLERAYKNIPTVQGGEDRFELPDLELLSEGNKTIIRNFIDVCKVLRREPKDIGKYLSKELAVPYVIDGKRLIFNGSVNSKLVITKLLDFVNRYVRCKTCGKYDSHFEQVDKNVKFLVCEACGSRTPLRL